MMTDLKNFIESLDMYKTIADFPMQELFKFVRFEDGLPKSIIMQKDKIA